MLDRAHLPVVVVAAHPDDETIGMGAHLVEFQDLTLVHVTDGAPRDMRDAIAKGFSEREDYANARRRELNAALAAGGVKPKRTLQLGFVDQEATLNLPELIRRLASLPEPAMVITHPYEGGHPDHDATAFAVHAWAIPRRIPLIEMTSYHSRDGVWVACEFLPGDTQEWTFHLSEEQRERKRRMFDCFVTQAHILARFPIEIERFRPAPDYDFTRPPHEGPLHYDRFDWGWTGERWRALASEALR